VVVGVLSDLSVGGRTYRWTEWVPLDQALAEPVLPADPGLYRVRRTATREVVYIGQTGVGIRARVRMLRGIAGDEMPYRDPHMAAPALWCSSSRPAASSRLPASRSRGMPSGVRA
jgi:hypothetical protein